MYCNSCGKQNPDDSKFCSNCGKPTRGDLVEYSTTAHKSVIREVKINFKLPNGSYPSASQYYKMFSNWQSEWEWNPSHIELKTMREILIKTINKWIENGWELIDTINDDLLLKDHYKDETPMSKLGSFLRTNWDYTYKQTWTYYGARFHIKSTSSVVQIPENTTININGSDLDPVLFGEEAIEEPVEELSDDFSKMTYRQRFAISEYGYLLSPKDAEIVGKMLGNFQSKDILPYCEAHGKKVSNPPKF